MEPRDLIVLSPVGTADPSLAIAACRAGAWGVLDLEFVPPGAKPRAALLRLTRFAGPNFGVLLSANAAEIFSLFAQLKPARAILAGAADAEALAARVRELKFAGIDALCEAVSVAEAKQAVEAGCSGVVLKGHE